MSITRAGDRAPLLPPVSSGPSPGRRRKATAEPSRGLEPVHRCNDSASSQPLAARAPPSPYARHPGDVGRDAGEDGGFALDVAAQTGDKAGDAMNLVLPIHRAVQGTARIALPDRGTRMRWEKWGWWWDAGGESGMLGSYLAAGAYAVTAGADHGGLDGGAPVGGAGADLVVYHRQVRLQQDAGELPVGCMQPSAG